VKNTISAFAVVLAALVLGVTGGRDGGDCGGDDSPWDVAPAGISVVG